MKCPKCGEELKLGTKFCTKCGANLEEAKAELEAKKKEEQERLAEEKRKEEEAKRLEKEKELEEKKKEEESMAKLEEVMKDEVVEEVKEEQKVPENEFKVKKEDKPKKEKKVKKKKGFFRRFLDWLLLVIIIAAVLIGGMYYLYKQELLPDVISDEIDDFVEKFEFVKDNWKEEKKDDDKKEDEAKEEEKIDWEVEPTLKLDDIKELNDEVSIAEKDGKVGLVSNKTGKIVLDTKYDRISILDIYKVNEDMSTAKEGIVIQEGEKYYTVDSKFQKSDEVNVVGRGGGVEYYYDHFNEIVYDVELGADKHVNIPESELKKGESKLYVCTDMEMVTIDGKSAKDDELGNSFELDFDKSKVYDKGYFDTTTGKLMIDCVYEEAEEFSEGYAAVKKDGKAGFIDEKGKTVVDFKFENTRSIHNGLAWAKKDGKWGLIKPEIK